MAKKKLPPSKPSKAYLVSFGDTMTALLAFFIVINSLAKEQTGANMYAGTGSFVNAFSRSAMPGPKPGTRSKDVVQQESQMPLYALADKGNSDANVGPDDTEKNERIMDRNKEDFQKFLSDIEQNFNLKALPQLENQTVVDSFAKIDQNERSFSTETLQLLADSIPKLRNNNINLEVIIWANVPSKTNLDQKLAQSQYLKDEIERAFWIKPDEKRRIRYRVKPWLFSDAKRPVVSVVFSKTGMISDEQ